MLTLSSQKTNKNVCLSQNKTRLNCNFCETFLRSYHNIYVGIRWSINWNNCITIVTSRLKHAHTLIYMQYSSITVNVRAVDGQMRDWQWLDEDGEPAAVIGWTLSGRDRVLKRLSLLKMTDLQQRLTVLMSLSCVSGPWDTSESVNGLPVNNVKTSFSHETLLEIKHQLRAERIVGRNSKPSSLCLCLFKGAVSDVSCLDKLCQTSWIT